MTVFHVKSKSTGSYFGKYATATAARSAARKAVSDRKNGAVDWVPATRNKTRVNKVFELNVTGKPDQDDEEHNIESISGGEVTGSGTYLPTGERDYTVEFQTREEAKAAKRDLEINGYDVGDIYNSEADTKRLKTRRLKALSTSDKGMRDKINDHARELQDLALEIQASGNNGAVADKLFEARSTVEAAAGLIGKSAEPAVDDLESQLAEVPVQ